jgi:hypothetical protein
VGYQEAMAQYLRSISDIRIEWIKPTGSKTERLALITDLIKNGVIVFIKNPKVERLVE